MKLLNIFGMYKLEYFIVNLFFSNSINWKLSINELNFIEYIAFIIFLFTCLNNNPLFSLKKSYINFDKKLSKKCAVEK
jgi:hypothetical protein